jgi:hypothetical protein
MRQGSRLSILARLALWAAVRARWWCVTIAGIAQIALFRLIRFTLKLLRCTQESHGSMSMAAVIDQPKPFQMKQIIAQRSVSRWAIRSERGY